MEPTQSSTSSKLHKSSIPLENSPWNSHLYPPQPWLNGYNNPSMLFSASNGSHGFNLNHEEDEELDDQTSIDVTQNPNRDYEMMEKEPMFEKPLTPSDVGKLNRLVIPKQHAEKYFPLSGDSGDKGLLLSFEDESGKCWRFRYSYWNSSQSYVLTKGWSRYVKEKQLDAGDIILFQRHRTDGDRLFIGWRRRGAAVTLMDGGGKLNNNNGTVMGNSGGGGGCNEGWSRGLYQVQGNPYLGHIQGHGANVPYQPDCLHAGSIAQNEAGGGNPKRLVRLFGVNLECHLDESEPSTPDSSSVFSQGPTLHPFYSQSYTSNYMDITFSRDINQMRNNQG